MKTSGMPANESQNAQPIEELEDLKPNLSDLDIEGFIQYHSNVMKNRAIALFFNGVFYDPDVFNELIIAIQNTECTKLGIISQKEGYTTFKISQNPYTATLITIPYTKSFNNE